MREVISVHVGQAGVHLRGSAFSRASHLRQFTFICPDYTYMAGAWDRHWQCGAPVGREEVGARVILLSVGLVTLRCILRSAQLMGRSA